MGDAPPPSQAKLAEAFMATFNTRKKELMTSIECLSENSVDSNEQLTTILSGIQNLGKILHDASLFLPSYSVKIRQNEIRDLEKSLKDKDDELNPKKRFGFKSKQVPIPNSYYVENKLDVEASTAATKKKTNEDSNFVTIENLENTTAVFEDEKVSKTDVLLRNLTNVVIHLNGSPSTLRISNVTHCKILCGPVHTSVFVESALHCVLFLCCQQLRTHASKDTDIYLRVRSRAIIEECSAIRFAPYVWDHPLSQKLHEAAQIESDLERFEAVDDFNWLSSSHSPNWSILPIEERVLFPSISSSD